MKYVVPTLAVLFFCFQLSILYLIKTNRIPSYDSYEFYELTHKNK